MANLTEAHPDDHQCFNGGLHVIQRSDRLRVGLSSDLIIEQVLMISMETSGGLTRGRWMTEQQHLMWLLPMPACAEVNQAMQELTGVNYSTGKQNKDMRKAIQARDWKDTLAVVQYLQGLNPFSNEPSMRNIATAVHAHPIINVDTARSVGAAILKSMEGKTSDEHSFIRKDQVVTLGTKSSFKVDGVEAQVDPKLLFQRLIIVAQTSDKLESAFNHELCSYSPALFDSSLLLRDAHGPALADAIWVFLNLMFKPMSQIKTVDMSWVGGGGVLIQRIPWSRGSSTSKLSM